MDVLLIDGGKRLEGAIEVPSAKNAALPLLCLSILTKDEVSFSNLPQVADIKHLQKLLIEMGAEVRGTQGLQMTSIRSTVAPYDLVRKMRASILVLGPLLARSGHAEVSMPGGCAIGERPVDIHLKGLEALGARISLEGGYIKASASQLKGARFVLDFPTVTGTINIVAAAVLARGDTELENVAREPEVVEVCDALNQMGAKIEGHGSSQIHIHGVTSLRGLRSWTIQPDRIQLLTYMAAAAITGGRITCRPYRASAINAAIQKFREMGCDVIESPESIELKAPSRLKAIQIETAPFPGFPTDAQAQFMACAAVAEGVSTIRETIFENRFNHVSELRRLGAQIDVEGNLAVITGTSKLSAANVMASDLRASASLVLAAIKAEGITKVLRIYHLDRGYEGLESRLTALGAKVWRESE